MFIMPQEVMDLTPYTDVTIEEVKQAQFVIEIFVGRTESEVDGARDKSILARAVAAQTVYMRENKEVVFEQAEVTMINQGGQLVMFDKNSNAPFIAPLAIRACKKLSWFGSRSVSVSRWHQPYGRVEWVRD